MTSTPMGIWNLDAMDSSDNRQPFVEDEPKLTWGDYAMVVGYFVIIIATGIWVCIGRLEIRDESCYQN